MTVLDKEIKGNPAKGEQVVARKDTSCGHCRQAVLSEDKFCRHCGATLVTDIEYDKLDMYALEYAKAR